MDDATFYRTIVETSPDGIWVIDLQGRTIYANEVISRMYGIAHEDVGRLWAQDTLDAPGKVEFEEHLRSVRAGTLNKVDVEVRFHDKDGNGTWITLRESPLHDADGTLVALLHRTSEYDDRYQVLAELRSSRQQLEEAQRIAKLGSWIYDIPHARLTVLGGEDAYQPEAWRDSEVAQFLELIHPDDLAHTLAITEVLRDGRSEFSLDTRLLSGGEWVALRVRGVIHRDAEGRPTTVAGTHQDVTELRATEQALRDEVQQAALMRAISTAANGATSLVEVLAVARPLLLEHGSWERSAVFALDEDGEPVAVHDDVHPDDVALARETRRDRAPRWSADGQSLAVPIMVADRLFAICTVTAPLPSQRRQTVEETMCSVAQQLGRVAEREETQHTLAAARDEAMSASRQKSQFLATMSHEIRTPLNGIIGLNDLLLRTDLDPAQQRLSSGVHVASRALLNVINDVLDYSKIDGGALEIEHVDLDVRSMLDQVVRVLSGSAIVAGVELIVSCHHDVPAIVLGDPTRLSQVLLNLVSNAVKFSEGGEVLVRVGVDPVGVDPVGVDDIHLRFEVRDTGIGIEPEHVARLFEPFVQGDASTTRRYGGTGLGLAISRELVAALGGELGYEPNPGGGSVFCFTVACERLPEQTAGLDDYARSGLSGRRILVADSAELRAVALAEQLTWWHLRTTRAPDPASVHRALAESLASDDPFDAILIDLDDDGIGLDLVDSIASEAAYDAIAMLAIGTASQSVMTRLRNAGVSVALGRPVPAETLRGALLEQVAGVPAQPSRRHAHDVPMTERTRILVVEDNPVNQLVATGILESLGYAVEISPDGAHALDVLATTTFGAILMDVQMPVLDGYATTRTVREREGGQTHVPIIAMTAAAVDGERERCLEAGMDEFLTKPIEPAILAAVLGRWVTTAEEPMPDTSRDAFPPTPPIPGLDTERLDMLRDLDPGDTTYLDRAIGNFQVNSVAAVDAIRDLVAAGDVPGLKATAHKIAGSALNLGVPRAGQTARALELLADTGTVEGAGPLLVELDEAMTSGRKLLLDYQRTYTDS